MVIKAPWNNEIARFNDKPVREREEDSLYFSDVFMEEDSSKRCLKRGTGVSRSVLRNEIDFYLWLKMQNIVGTSIAYQLPKSVAASKGALPEAPALEIAELNSLKARMTKEQRIRCFFDYIPGLEKKSYKELRHAMRPKTLDLGTHNHQFVMRNYTLEDPEGVRGETLEELVKPENPPRGIESRQEPFMIPSRVVDIRQALAIIYLMLRKDEAYREKGILHMDLVPGNVVLLYKQEFNIANGARQITRWDKLVDVEFSDWGLVKRENDPLSRFFNQEAQKVTGLTKQYVNNYLGDAVRKIPYHHLAGAPLEMRLIGSIDNAANSKHNMYFIANMFVSMVTGLNPYYISGDFLRVYLNYYEQSVGHSQALNIYYEKIRDGFRRLESTYERIIPAKVWLTLIRSFEGIHRYARNPTLKLGDAVLESRLKKFGSDIDNALMSRTPPSEDVEQVDAESDTKAIPGYKRLLFKGLIDNCNAHDIDVATNKQALSTLLETMIKGTSAFDARSFTSEDIDKVITEGLTSTRHNEKVTDLPDIKEMAIQIPLPGLPDLLGAVDYKPSTVAALIQATDSTITVPQALYKYERLPEKKQTSGTSWWKYAGIGGGILAAFSALMIAGVYIDKCSESKKENVSSPKTTISYIGNYVGQDEVISEISDVFAQDNLDAKDTIQAPDSAPSEPPIEIVIPKEKEKGKSFWSDFIGKAQQIWSILSSYKGKVSETPQFKEPEIPKEPQEPKVDIPQPVKACTARSIRYDESYHVSEEVRVPLTDFFRNCTPTDLEEIVVKPVCGRINVKYVKDEGIIVVKPLKLPSGPYMGNSCFTATLANGQEGKVYIEFVNAKPRINTKNCAIEGVLSIPEDSKDKSFNPNRCFNDDGNLTFEYEISGGETKDRIERVPLKNGEINFVTTELDYFTLSEDDRMTVIVKAKDENNNPVPYQFYVKITPVDDCLRVVEPAFSRVVYIPQGSYAALRKDAFFIDPEGDAFKLTSGSDKVWVRNGNEGYIVVRNKQKDENNQNNGAALGKVHTIDLVVNREGGECQTKDGGTTTKYDETADLQVYFHGWTQVSLKNGYHISVRVLDENLAKNKVGIPSDKAMQCTGYPTTISASEEWVSKLSKSITDANAESGEVDIYDGVTGWRIYNSDGTPTKDFKFESNPQRDKEDIGVDNPFWVGIVSNACQFIFKLENLAEGYKGNVCLDVKVEKDKKR